MKKKSPVDLVRTRTMVDEIKYCMMTTINPEGHLLSRPMTAIKVDDAGHLWFIASEASEQAAAFDQDEHVNLAFSAPDRSEYLSITGTATVTKDSAKISELWTPEAADWFPFGRDDTRICAIQVVPQSAEAWA
jgi:general stress protein 26